MSAIGRRPIASGSGQTAGREKGSLCVGLHAYWYGHKLAAARLRPRRNRHPLSFTWNLVASRSYTNSHKALLCHLVHGTDGSNTARTPLEGPSGPCSHTLERERERERESEREYTKLQNTRTPEISKKTRYQVVRAIIKYDVRRHETRKYDIARSAMN